MSRPEQTREQTREHARWLTGPDGLEAVRAATEALDAGTDELGLGTRLRRDGLAPPAADLVVDAALARRRAREHWTDADQLLFTRAGLEQASDPRVSAWRAERIAARADGAPVVDACAGIGGDALALAATGLPVLAVEADPLRAELLAHNARLRDVEVTVVTADVLTLPLAPGTLVHVDPGRRRDGRRVRRLADHQPAVGALVAWLRTAAGFGLTLGPAVDLAEPDLPGNAELAFVAVDGALKETTAWSGRLRDGDTEASATLLPTGAHLRRTGPPKTLPVGPVGDWLVQVSPAAIRARMHDHLGVGLKAHRVARRLALLTTDTTPPPSPWYQAWPVEAVLGARPPAVRRWLRDAEPAPLEIAVHGLDVDPVRYWQQLGRPPRGPQGRRVELVRTETGAQAIVVRHRPDA